MRRQIKQNPFSPTVWGYVIIIIDLKEGWVSLRLHVTACVYVICMGACNVGACVGGGGRNKHMRNTPRTYYAYYTYET